MKQEQPKKVEIMLNHKRFFIGEAAAKIAIETMGATEVTPFAAPRALKIKPPPIIPAEPVYKKIEVPEPVIKKPEPIKASVINPEPINPKPINPVHVPKGVNSVKAPVKRTKKTKK